MSTWPELLAEQGISTPERLAHTALVTLALTEGIDQLSRGDWTRATSSLKYLLRRPHQQSFGSASEHALLATSGILTANMGNEPLEAIDLPPSAISALHRCGIQNIESLCCTTAIRIAAIPYLGSTRLAEIVRVLHRYLTEPVAIPRTGGGYAPLTSLVVSGDNLGPARISDLLSPECSSGQGTILEVVSAVRRGEPRALYDFGQSTVRDLLRVDILQHLTEADRRNVFHRLRYVGQTQKPLVNPVFTSAIPWTPKGRPLSMLPVSSRTGNALIRAGLGSIESVLQSTCADLARVRQFGVNAFSEMLQVLSGSCSLAPDSPDVSMAQTTVPDEASQLPAAFAAAGRGKSKWQSNAVAAELRIDYQSLEALFGEWLERLGEERRSVVQRRLGFGGRQTDTLETIAADMGLSRACVSQMEASACKRLAKRTRFTAVSEARSTLEALVERHGGLLGEVEIVSELPSEVNLGSLNPLFVCRVLAIGSDQLKWLRGLRALGLTSFPVSFAPQIQQELLRLLKRADRQLEPEDLLRVFQRSSFARRECPDIEPSFIAACLRLHPQIKSAGGTLSLPGTLRRSSARILVRALRMLGQPASLDEILGEANARLSEPLRLDPELARSILLSERETFVVTGQDAFTLSAWATPRRESIADGAYRILKTAGHPLPLSMIVNEVAGTLGVQPQSIRVRIYSDPRFHRVSRGLYTIKEIASEYDDYELTEDICPGLFETAGCSAS